MRASRTYPQFHSLSGSFGLRVGYGGWIGDVRHAYVCGAYLMRAQLIAFAPLRFSEVYGIAGKEPGVSCSSDGQAV